MGKSKHAVWCAVLILLTAACDWAQAQDGEGARRALEVKGKVEKIGTDARRRVRVELRGGRKLEGYIGQIGEEHFYVVRTDKERGTAAVVAFDAVESVEKRSETSWRDVVYRTGLGAGALLGFLRDLGSMITPAFPAAP